MANRVLLADDDQELSALLTEYLSQEGFTVQQVYDGGAALDALRNTNPEILVLDIMMPVMSGIDVLRELRSNSNLPVLMLTAKGDDTDRIVGLELGADDYLPKPCNPRELVARLRAILRRASGQAHGQTLIVDELEIRPASREALLDGQPLDLTSTEFSLLLALMEQAGQVVNKRELYLAALGREPMRFDRSIDMHMSNLRRKLGDRDDGRERFQTVRGLGYQLTVTD